MATGKGSATHAEVHSICDGLECSPSKTQKSSNVHSAHSMGHDAHNKRIGKKGGKGGKLASAKKRQIS